MFWRTSGVHPLIGWSPPMPAPDKMLTPEQAQQIVLEAIHPLGVERVSLLEALGRVLAADIQARHDTPPGDNSAMDGYAVRCQDITDATPAHPALLEVIEDLPAGHLPRKVVGSGQASRIMTGALVPQGADTVIRVEDTRLEGQRVAILEPDEEGANIRRRGEDVRSGQVILQANTPCGPGELAMLASQQRAFLPVFRRPTLAILSTGDELVEIDEALAPGRIVNSNTCGLAALALANGATPLMLPIARDDQTAIRRAVETALAADFILSSGGVSVGEYDYVKNVLDELGAEVKLWRVAMKPGKPLFFCTLQGRPYFGLPGNPVSSLISFLQFVRPAIRKASGYPAAQWLLPAARARMENPIHNPGDRRQYARARLRFSGGRLLASTPVAQNSHILTSMLGANGLVVLEPEQRAEAGDEVTVQLIGPLG